VSSARIESAIRARAAELLEAGRGRRAQKGLIQMSRSAALADFAHSRPAGRKPPQHQTRAFPAFAHVEFQQNGRIIQSYLDLGYTI
jgi:hypothetical protein